MPAKILIVEDERLVALQLKTALAALQYEVLDTAASAERALNIIGESSPDLVLMDIGINGDLDGVSLAALIKDRYNIPIVFLTAHSDEDTLRRVQMTEPGGYIVKPFRDEELRPVIEVALFNHRTTQERAGKFGVANAVGVQAAPLGSRDSQLSFLRKLQFFDVLPAARLKELADRCTIDEVEPGSFITFEGERIPMPFILLKGRVAMSKTSVDGKELIVELLTPGDLFGLVIGSENLPAHLTSQVRVPSEILWVPKTFFALLLEEFPSLRQRLNTFISYRLRVSHEISRALAHDSVEHRVAFVLCYILKRLHEAEKCESDYEIRMTRQELSALVGSTLDTTIRVTKDLERRGILDLSRREHIRVPEIDALEELTDCQLW